MIFKHLVISFWLVSLPWVQEVIYPDYLPQAGVPILTQNFISPEDGCNWVGVAGQVFGLDGLPANGRIIELHGEFNGGNIILATTSGSSLQMGPGGYEMQIGDHPVATQGSLYLQLIDANAEPVSRKIFFNTGSSCDKNLTIINFIAFDTAMELYFPFISITK